MDFLKRRWKPLGLTAIALLLIAYVGLGLMIGHGVKQAVADATGRHPGDPVPALVAVALDGDRSLDDRNRAIWALGQLGDPAALPALEGLATGRDCDHATTVCQKEVRKALEGCRGELNLAAPLWRHGELARR